ncbi:hypothetical protein FRB91_007040 [Serendipita sp. 411]|nr:hypothetical protein FRB91_007040 [Serendipita sp. 411]
MFGDERRRQINLGGAHSTATHASVLAQTQQARERRRNEKRAHASASIIQSRWRAWAARAKVQAEMLRAFDSEPIGTVASARYLVLGGGEHTRLVAFANAALKAREKAVFQPFFGPESSSWLVLLRQIACLMLTQVAGDPHSSNSKALLRFINILAAKRPLSDTSDIPVGEATLQYLICRDMYFKLSKCMSSIPISPKGKSKPSITLPGLIELCVAPFKQFRSSQPAYHQSLTQVMVHIMTIPLLPNRILSSLADFNNHVPFGALDLVDLATVSNVVAVDVSTLHLLANLITFVSPRHAPNTQLPMTNAALLSYISLLNNILSVIPSNSLEIWKEDLTSVNPWANDDSDEEDHPSAPRSVRSRPSIFPTDEKTAAKLSNLVSQANMDSLLIAANRSPSTWQQFLQLVINIGAKWPAKRESVLSTIVVGSGNFIFKQLWRDSVRRSPLGADISGSALRNPQFKNDWPALLLLTELYTQALLTMTDDEFFSNTARTGSTAARNPFIIGEVVLFSRQLLNIAFYLYWNEDANSIQSCTIPGLPVSWELVRERFTKCLQAIHARDSRRPFTPPNHWLVMDQLDVRSFVEAAIIEDQQLEDDNNSLRKLTKRELAYLSPRLGILNNIPFAIPFESRVSIFRSFIGNDQNKQDTSNLWGGLRGQKVVIRRDNVSQDGFDRLNELGAAWKGRLAITFIDQFGQEEAGIDGGGVFKEFLTSLSREVFDTNRGLWLATKQQELYPNSHSYAKESHQLNWYRFIGRVLGKALYEGILVDVAFAGFFLAKWLGKQSFLDDLASLDPELYQGLIFLKNYPGNPEELSLDFSINEEDLGITRTIELKPGGASIPVTKDNRLEYIYLVSYYRLTAQIKQQCDAFFEGLSDIIDPKWLRMFNQQELKILFAIRDAGIDTSRLPTASTCVNLLKLPLYQDEETMRKKLLHAINSGAGFDLS